MRGIVLPPAVLIAFIALVAWAYLPGVSGPMLLDDHGSLKPLVGLHESPEFAWEYIFGEQSGPLGRPVAMASFVAERVCFGSDIAVTKTVNIAIHLINGVLVAWLFVLLFRPLRFPGSRYLAVVLAGIWLASPLWVSSVLYAVQRMAVLSTTFMLSALISYCYCRSRLIRPPSFALMLTVPTAFVVLGVFTKENAVSVVPVILALELLWFQCRGEDGSELTWLQRGSLALVVLGVVILSLVFFLSFNEITASYRGRNFTLLERLLTQARVLWDYVAQFVWPQVGRMGIYHDDIAISRSLSDPGITLYAVLGWALVILASLALAVCSGPMVKRLAIVPAWYLLGHAVESTVLPLEIYFEHRNYFPAIGLLTLPALGFVVAVRMWPETVRPLLVYAALAVGFLLFLTSSQVQVWSSRSLLAFNHITGHPDSYRANTDMAVIMASLGDYERAAIYSTRAQATNPHRRSGDFHIRNLALACMANRAVSPEIFSSLGSGEQRPLSSSLSLLVLVRMLEEDRCPSFDRVAFANRLVTLYLGADASAHGNRSVYIGLALLENALRRFEIADQYIDRYLQMQPENVRALLMKLHFSTGLRNREAVVKLVGQLQRLDAEGKLSERQRQTLALYMEN